MKRPQQNLAEDKRFISHYGLEPTMVDNLMESRVHLERILGRKMSLEEVYVTEMGDLPEDPWEDEADVRILDPIDPQMLTNAERSRMAAMDSVIARLKAERQAKG